MLCQSVQSFVFLDKIIENNYFVLILAHFGNYEY